MLYSFFGIQDLRSSVVVATFHQNYDAIRIRGIPKSKAKDARDKEKADLNAVHGILNQLQASCQIQDLRRQEKYDEKKNENVSSQREFLGSKTDIVIALQT